MTAFLTSLFPGLTSDGIAVLVVATFLGGLVRGFTGFGFAMVTLTLLVWVRLGSRKDTTG